MTRLPKDSGYRSDRERRASRYRKLRPSVRYAAWQQDDQRCVFPTCRRWVPLEEAHIHETHARGFGGDACDLDIAVTTCRFCHADIHVRVGGKRRRIEGTRSEGLRFYQRIGHSSDWKEVFA